MSGAPFHDLRGFLDDCRRAGELLVVEEPVDPVFEAGALAQLAQREGGPVLLFLRPTGADFPLAMNLLGTPARVERALGRPPRAIGEQLARILVGLQPPSPQAVWELRHDLFSAANIRPRAVRSGPVLRHGGAPDLGRLPVLHCWPGDAGRFFTLPQVITADVGGHGQNVGMYRLQVKGPDRTGLHIQIQRGGGNHLVEARRAGVERIPVAVAVGGDPTCWVAAAAPLPENLDEYAFAGILRGARTRLVRGPVTGLAVPAEADFVFEGFVRPAYVEPEGPFGDHFGHYSHRADYPVFEIERAWHRPGAIYCATIVGRPPQEDNPMGEALQDLMVPLIPVLHPEIRDVHTYAAAGFHGLGAAAVRARYRKESMRSALWLLGEGQMSLTKVLMMVDDDVPVRDPRAVLRAVRDHFRPEEDLLILPNVHFDTLDFTSLKMNEGSKMVLDATAKGRSPRAPRELAPAAAAIADHLGDQGVTDHAVIEDCLVVLKTSRRRAPDLLAAALAHPRSDGIPLLALVDDDVDLGDLTDVLFGVFVRFDPARDVQCAEVELRGACVRHGGTVGMDATMKPGYPEPLTLPADVRRRAEERWATLQNR